MRSLRKGFTLIEVLIILAIIAILVSIAVPNFQEAQRRSKAKATPTQPAAQQVFKIKRADGTVVFSSAEPQAGAGTWITYVDFKTSKTLSISDAKEIEVVKPEDASAAR